jgi:hypothetical protein
MIAEFEADLVRMRTIGGMKVARAEGRLRASGASFGARSEAILGGSSQRSMVELDAPGGGRPQTADGVRASLPVLAMVISEAASAWASGSVYSVPPTTM